MKPRSLRMRLLILTMAAATLPALGITWVLRSISIHALEQNIERAQREQAHRVADDVNSEIHSAQSMLMFAARQLYRSQLRPIEVHASLDNLIRSVPTFEEVLVVLGTGQERMKRNREGIDRRLIRRPVNLQRSMVSPPFFSGKQLPTVLLSEPIRLDGESMSSAALMAKMSFSALGELMRASKIGDGGSAFIVNDRGTVLAHADEILVRRHANLANLPVFQAWQQNQQEPTGLVESNDPQAGEMMAIAYPIPLLRSAVIVQEPLRQVYAPIDRMRGQYLLWAGVWLMMFIGITWFVAWRILQPLRQLHDAVEELGRGGRNIELDIQTRDELEELGHALNTTTRSLKHAEELRQDFMHMLVHDLKAPLNSIMTSVEFLIAGERGPLSPDQKSFLQLAYRSGHDLLSMVQDLLDVAKMEEGKLKLQMEGLVPGPWVKPILDSFRPQVESQKKKLVLDTDDNLPIIQMDRSLLTRVLRNLLMNAFHHTFYAVGEIRVALRREDDGVCLSVQDNGEGIDAQDLPRLFEKFSTSKEPPSRRVKGSGVGLAFCKMAIELHGGRISVHSQKGEGSIFRVWLPVKSGSPTPKTLEEVLASEKVYPPKTRSSP